MITYKTRIDINGDKSMSGDLVFTTGDMQAYRLYFFFYDGSRPYDTTGCKLIIKAKRADGLVITDLGCIDEEGCYYDVKPEMYAVFGVVYFEIALCKTGESSYVTAKELCFEVREGFDSESAETEQTSPMITKLLTVAETASESAARAEAAVAEVKEETQAAVDEAVEESKMYADAAAEGAYSKSKDYTVEAVEETRSYANSVANRAESNANGYTDEAVTAAKEDVKTYADDVASTAESNAKTYADAAADGAVQTVRNEAANAFIGAASGAAVRFDDVSPVEHELGVSVRSKNLLDISSRFFAENEDGSFSQISYGGLGALLGSGLKFTYENDGMVKVDGTPDYDVSFPLGEYNLKKKGIHVLSGAPEGAGADTYFLYFGTAADYGASCVVSDITGEKTLGITVKKGVTVENLIFKPQLEVGSVATVFAPYADVSGAHALCCGGNLLNVPYELTVTSYQDIVFPVPLKAGAAYTVYFDAAETDGAGGSFNIVFCLADSSVDSTRTRVYMTTAGVGYTITPVKDVKTGWIFSKGYSVNSGVTATIKGLRLYVADGDEVLPYAPYVEAVSYAANEDGSVSGVMSLSPDMTLMTDTEGAVVDCTYHRDSNAVYEELVSAILSLGGNV